MIEKSGKAGAGDVYMLGGASVETRSTNPQLKVHIASKGVVHVEPRENKSVEVGGYDQEGGRFYTGFPPCMCGLQPLTLTLARQHAW